MNLEPVLLLAPVSSRAGLAAELATHRLKTPPQPGRQAFPTAVGRLAMPLLPNLQQSGRPVRRAPNC